MVNGTEIEFLEKKRTLCSSVDALHYARCVSVYAQKVSILKNLRD
jgi:hypothetical protein